MLYNAATASNQPQRRGLPVVAPNSLPKSCIFSPTLFKSSVGKGPFPTLVTYALNMPIIFSNLDIGTPSPDDIPPIVGLEEVTNG